MFNSLSDKLDNVFKKLRGHGKLSEDNIKSSLKEVKLALLSADVNFKIVKSFIKNVEKRAIGKDVLNSITPAQQVIQYVHEELIHILGEKNVELNFNKKEITKIMLVGLQGSGKTTQSGKLALLLRKSNNRPLLVACDIYRPAAIKQLKTIGKQL